MRLLETWGPEFEAQAQQWLQPPDLGEGWLDELPRLVERYKQIRAEGNEAHAHDEPPALPPKPSNRP